MATNYRQQMIKDYIVRNEQEFPEPMNYYQDSVEKMRNINLTRFAKEDAAGIIKAYLYKWGKMQRALNREKINDIVEQIQSNHEKLEKFRKKKLSGIDIGKFKSDIEQCYDSFEEIIGKVGAAKVLHLICPDFFPLWDTRIADAFKQENKGKIHKDFSGADYYEFMRWIKNFMQEYGDILAERNGRTKVKVLDDFLWALANRPLMIFVKTENR